MNLLLVGFGGAFGAICRYLLGLWLGRSLGAAWPYSTFAANLIGGLLMGLLVGYLAFRGGDDPERLRLLLGVGVLGGFTTFSSFSLEVLSMIETRNAGQALGYVAASVVLAVGAVFLGMIAARRVFA